MRKAWLFALTACLMTLPALAQPDGAGFGVACPPAWSSEKGAFGTDLALVAPTAGAGGFQENVNVVVRPTDAASLEGYSRTAIRQLLDAVPDARLLESRRVKLSGMPAWRVVYTGRLGRWRMRWLQEWSLRRGKVYVITYSAEAADFHGSFSGAARAIASFKFLDRTARSI